MHAYCTSHEISDVKVTLCSASDLVAAYRETWSYIDIQASAGNVEVDERVFKIMIKTASLSPWAVWGFFWGGLRLDAEERCEKKSDK